MGLLVKHGPYQGDSGGPLVARFETCSHSDHLVNRTYQVLGSKMGLRVKNEPWEVYVIWANFHNVWILEKKEAHVSCYFLGRRLWMVKKTRGQWLGWSAGEQAQVSVNVVMKCR